MKKESHTYHELEDHVVRTWPHNKRQEFTWDLGPIKEVIPHFRVIRVEPKTRDEPWIYASLGAWEATKDEGFGLEFCILSPVETPRHVETLAMVAFFHWDPRYRLKLGKTINIGHPWIEGSKCDRLFVSLPYPYGPEFENCHTGKIHINFLWLVPITAEEEKYLNEKGQETFEQLLEDSGVDLIDPTRRSVA